MGFIKTPISIAKFGIKAVTNTAFYGLALYGALNVAINTYSAVKYIKSVQNPKQEIVQTAQESIERKVRDSTAEAIMGESIDQKIAEQVAKYMENRQLLERLKSNEDYIGYSPE